MSLRTPDLLFTAIAPAIWGSTYIVTTQYLPNFSPMTVAMLRALPAGLLLVMIVRQIPTGIWWMRRHSSSAHLIFRYSGACCLFRSTACRAGSRRR
ncbi:EamA family transporter [Escherichia coli]